MKESLDPLDPALEALLETERGASFPQATLDRAWSRIGPALALSAAAPATPAAHASALKAWLASHVVAVAASTFVLGVGTGMGLHAVATRPAPPRVESQPPPATPAPPAPLPLDSPKESVVAPSPVAPMGTNSAARSAGGPSLSAGSASSSSSRAERALVDEARTQLSAGEPARALALVDQHQHRFPRPQFGEECETLAIQALVLLGRRDEAARRAAAFRAASPNSLFLPVVDRALQSNP
jgi:hypothetical protein